MEPTTPAAALLPPPTPLPSPAPDAEPPSWRTIPWLIRDLLIGLSIPTALMVFALLFPGIARSIPRPLVWLGMAASLAWTLAFPLWTARKRLPGFHLTRPSWRSLFKEVLLSVPLCLLMWLMLALLVWLWSYLPTEQPSNPLADAPGQSWMLFVMVAAACTVGPVAPVAEEIFFRGFLYNGLRRYVPTGAAVVVQAAVFGMYHPYNLSYVVAASGLGLYLALIYEWRKSLVAPICLHIMQNGLAAATALVIVFQNAGAPILGIQGEPAPEGLRVTVVFDDTGAAKAGIQPGDVITVIEEWSVHNLREVKWVMRQRHAGDRVRVELLRNGDPLTVLAELTPPPTRARTEP